MNVEQRIRALKVPHRQIDALFPNRQILRIARLQLDQLLPAGLAHGRIDCRSLVGLFVNADQLGNRIARKGLSIQQIFPAVNHHPELRPPIADVIVADDFVTEKLRNPREGIAEHSAADVPDVHRLRHVG